MDLVFESTDIFEQEINLLDNQQRSLIIETINSFFNLLLSNPEDFYRQIEQPLNFSLDNDYESSLYLFKVNENLTFIFSIDEDPIFERIIITLFRLVSANEGEKVYGEVGDLLYHDFLSSESKKVPVSA